jgi:polyisoprenoid-binding protein YceI
MISRTKYALFASAILLAGAAHAEPKAYTFDAGHSQVVFSYQHLGFSTTSGMFSGISGTINFDEAKPDTSTVSVEFPISSLQTGDPGRNKHFQSADFFGGEGKAPNVSFKSTAIKVTGEKTAQITGELTLNGVTKPVVLDTVLNQKGQHPMENKPWIGFNATTTVKRTDFKLGMFAPAVSDDVVVQISVEASAVK